MDYKFQHGLQNKEPDDLTDNNIRNQELRDRLNTILDEFFVRPDTSVLMRLNWIMKDIEFSIEAEYTKYDLLPKLMNMISANTVECEFVLRIILYSARYYKCLLYKVVDYIDTFFVLMRSPKLFGYVMQLISGMLKYVNDAANILEEHKAIEKLSSMELSLPFSDMGIVCHFIAQILNSVNAEKFEDFDKIIIAPIGIVSHYINDIQDDEELITHLQNPNYISALSPLFLMFDSMLSLYSGDLSEILTDGIYSRLIKTTQNWPAIDSTGVLIGHVYMIWNRLVCDFLNDFIDMDVCTLIISSIMETIKHERMPRSRAIFLISNIAATELAQILIEYNVLTLLFENIEEMSSSEKENMLFLFMNLSQTCPGYISEAFFTRELAGECLSIAPTASSPKFISLAIRFFCFMKDTDPYAFESFDPDDINDLMDAFDDTEFDEDTNSLADVLSEFLESRLLRATELEQLAPEHN